MAQVTLGFVCQYSFTPPASVGHPKPKMVMDMMGTNGTIMPKAEAQLIAAALNQAGTALQLAMLPLDPGASNFGSNCAVFAVTATLPEQIVGGPITVTRVKV